MNSPFATPHRQKINSQSHYYRLSSPVQNLSPGIKTSAITTKEQNHSEEGQSLKDFSAKVKGRLKDSRNHEHSNDILLLKKTNKDMQALIDQFKIKIPVKKVESKEQEEENTPKISISPEPKESVINSSGKIDSEVIGTGLSLASFKREVLTRINTAIQANEQKLWKQQKYLSELERRFTQLESLKCTVDHLKFQRAVKIQSSPKKSKNYSRRVPQVAGDKIAEFQPQPQAQFSSDEIDKKDEEEQKQQRHLFENPYKHKQKQQLSSKDYQWLSQQYSDLQEQYAQLHERYDFQLQSKIKEQQQKENLVKNIEELSSQNRSLKKEINTLNERLKFSQEKYAGLQLFLKSHKSKISGKILPNIGASLSGELYSIINNLKIGCIDRYASIQLQLSELIIKKDYLQHENTTMQKKIIQGCKFSCTHREVFHLKEQIEELEKRCRNYRTELDEKNRIIEGKEDDKGEKINWEGIGKENQWVKWPTIVYYSVRMAVSRLEELLKECKTSAKV